jgi:hypothetical protein
MHITFLAGALPNITAEEILLAVDLNFTEHSQVRIF